MSTDVVLENLDYADIYLLTKKGEYEDDAEASGGGNKKYFIMSKKNVFLRVRRKSWKVIVTHL